MTTLSVTGVNKMAQASLASIFQANGRYNTQPLHLRALHDQLQDHDMGQLMPKSHDTVEVLAPFRAGDPGLFIAQTEGVGLALANHAIHHILMPIGPRHWRSMCLTKPTAESERYQLELFDPRGPNGAKCIKNNILALLSACGIEKENIDIHYTGPEKSQKDRYACGDFTCAYSHQKMRDLGVEATHYNQKLVHVYETYGNQRHSLRKASREETRQTKLTSFRLQEPAVPVTDRTTFNAYLSDEYARISYLTNPHEKLILLHQLNTSIESFEAKDTAQAPRSNSFFKRPENLHEQIRTALRNQSTQIITDFDRLTAAFREKIDNLIARQCTVAADAANALLADLEEAKQRFIHSHDLIAFHENIKRELDKIENHQIFATNRDTEWWQPIKLLIDILRWIIGGYTTDTTHKFEIYTEGLLSLGENETVSSQP